MATNTTNYNLSKPAYSDTADIAVINGNMDKVDTALDGLGSGLAIISKNNTHSAITAGQYVYVHGHGSLSEGLYTANSNISANGTLSSSNLTAVSKGGLNSVMDTMGLMVQSRITRCDKPVTSINVTNNSRHLFVISGTNAGTRTSIVMVASANNGTITMKEIAQSSNITVAIAGTNALTVTKDTETGTFFADFVLSGEFATITEVI